MNISTHKRIKRKILQTNLQSYKKRNNIKSPGKAEDEINRKAKDQLFVLVPKVVLFKNKKMDKIVKNLSKECASSPDYNTPSEYLDSTSCDSTAAVIGGNSSSDYNKSPVKENECNECNLNQSQKVMEDNSTSTTKNPVQETQVLNNVDESNLNQSQKVIEDNSTSTTKNSVQETEILNNVDESNLNQSQKVIEDNSTSTTKSPVKETQILNNVDECHLNENQEEIGYKSTSTTKSPVQETQILNNVDESNLNQSQNLIEDNSTSSTKSPVKKLQILSTANESNCKNNRKSSKRKSIQNYKLRSKRLKTLNHQEINTCPEKSMNEGVFKIEIIPKAIPSPEIQILFPKSIHDKITNTNVRISIDLAKLDLPWDSIADRLKTAQTNKTPKPMNKTNSQSEISQFFATFQTESQEEASPSPKAVDPTQLTNNDLTARTNPKTVHYTQNQNDQCVFMSTNPVSCADLEPAFSLDYELIQESLDIIQNDRRYEINASTSIAEIAEIQNPSHLPLPLDLNCFTSNFNAANDCLLPQDLENLFVNNFPQSNSVQSLGNVQQNVEMCSTTNAETLVSSTITDSEGLLSTEKNNTQNLEVPSAVDSMECSTIEHSANSTLVASEQNSIPQNTLTTKDVENLQMNCINEYLAYVDVPADDTLSIYAESLLDSLEANLNGEQNDKEDENRKKKSKSSAQATERTLKNNNKKNHCSANKKAITLPNSLSFLYNNASNLLDNYKIPKRVAGTRFTETDENTNGNHLHASKHNIETNIENCQNIENSQIIENCHNDERNVIYKLFNHICWKFVSGSCHKSKCKYNHSFISPQILKEKLLISDDRLLQQAYKFILRSDNLYSRYFTIFCEIYANKKSPEMICTIIQDSENLLKTFYVLKDVVKILVNTGLNKITAVTYVIDQIKHRKFEAIDAFIEMIIDDNILEFLSLLESFRCIPNYYYKISAINKIAAICNASKQVELSQFLLKVIIFNVDKKNLETYKGEDLLNFLTMVSSINGSSP